MGLLLTVGIRAEDAVEHSGIVHHGTLRREAAGWTFRDQAGSRVPSSRIAYIRFAGGKLPAPRRLATHSLRLDAGQIVSGKLIAIGAKAINFAPSWGESMMIPRDKVVGITQTDCAMVVAREDFSAPSQACLLTGSPLIESNAIWFHSPDQKLTRKWNPALRDGIVRLSVRTEKSDSGSRLRCELIGIQAKPCATFSDTRWSAENTKTLYAAVRSSETSDILDLDIRDKRLRIYLNDVCLGETPIDANDAITGIRIFTEAKEPGAKFAKVAFQELRVVRRVPFREIPGLVSDRDIIQLEHGEELFGRIRSANGDTVAFDAKFGKRQFAWTSVRGIFFASRNAMPSRALAEVSFRPGIGSQIDTLRGELIRWENERLLVRHDLLGMIALERGQLHRIRLAAK